jgi:malate/lactate dehydrogenase
VQAEGLFVGVPVKLGRRGIRGIVRSLAPDEAAALGRSAAAVRELTDKLGI